MKISGVFWGSNGHFSPVSGFISDHLPSREVTNKVLMAIVDPCHGGKGEGCIEHFENTLAIYVVLVYFGSSRFRFDYISHLFNYSIPLVIGKSPWKTDILRLRCNEEKTMKTTVFLTLLGPSAMGNIQGC